MNNRSTLPPKLKAARLDRIFDYICGLKKGTDGLSPSNREIVDAFDFIASPSHLQSTYLQALVDDGRIVILPGIPRGIMVRGGKWMAPGADEPQRKGAYLIEKGVAECLLCACLMDIYGGKLGEILVCQGCNEVRRAQRE